MSYVPVVETIESVMTRGRGQTFSKVVDVQGDRLTGYYLSYEKSGESHPTRFMARPKPTKQTSLPSDPARRDAIRRTLVAAEREADRMERLAEASDLMELSNSGFRLKEMLAELWDLRKEREDDWGDLLNLLQGALTQEEFERFSVKQCGTIRSIIAEHLGSGVVDGEDLERSIRLLRGAGFDPWKGISGKMEVEIQVE
jgi:hypothetical protein